MEFWGLEVKSGESIVVDIGDEMILHLSQACLGEIKKEKGSEHVLLFAKVGDQKFVLGTLSSEKFPQISFDLLFEKEFELSHNWKNGCVHFMGYKSLVNNQYYDTDDESDSEDEMIPIPIDHGKSNLQAKEEAKVTDISKAVKSGQRGSSGNDKKDSLSSDESDEEASDDEQAKVNNEEETSEDDFESDEDGSEDEESDSEDKDEEKKVDIGKKRPAEAAKKTPVTDKKAKLVTPDKTSAKSGSSKVSGHIATPHPAKQAKKTAANSDQAKQQTPKSGGAFPCKSCNRSFGSDIALQSHTKAKHDTTK